MPNGPKCQMDLKWDKMNLKWFMNVPKCTLRVLTGPKCQMDLKSKKWPKIGHETKKVENLT